MLTIHGGDYEHVLGVGEGSDRLAYDHQMAQAWRKVRKGEPFDATEFSLANLMLLKDRGAPALWALPIFPSRPFSHIALRVAKHSPMTSPRDFKGKRIGVPDYSMTAAVWARGLLNDEFGVHWSEIQWVSQTRQRFPPPPAAPLSFTDDDLEALCVAGELDGLVHAHPSEEGRPESERKLRTVIADNEGHERTQFLRTGFHPINHVVVVSQGALEREPGAARAIFDAYVGAKRRALKRRLGASMMPWGEARWGEMLETFRGDPFPYGLTPGNRQVVEKLGQLLAEQQMISRAPAIEEIFAPDALDLTEA